MTIQESETRVALIIGNSLYRHAGTLRNPANDAKVISQALGRLGFTGVKPQLNLGYHGLRCVLQDFARQADSADMAVIYFAGHGIEVNMRNFLIPVDARLERSKDVEFETISLDQVLTSVDGARQLRLIILDACRNNPFRARMLHAGGKRSIGNGLRAIEPSGNVLVAYAAKHGTYALDGKGENSPYVEALTSHIEKPGLEIGKLFREVRDDVLERTGREQEPYTYGSLGREDIYLRPPLEPNGDTLTPENGSVTDGAKPQAAVRVKPWRAAMVAGFGTATIAILMVLILLYGAKLLRPQPSPENDAEIRRVKELRDLVENHPHAPNAEEARKELAGLGFVRVRVGAVEAKHERWIEPGGKKEKKKQERWIEAGGGRKERESFQDCWKDKAGNEQCGPVMVVVPKGEFHIGSPTSDKMRSDDEDKMPGPGGEPVKIEFERPFAVGKFEISFADWDACYSEGACKDRPYRNEDEENHAGAHLGDDLPVVRVSWKQFTEEYLPWLNRKISGKPDGPYHLLSEAQWEYVARAGTSSRYWFGDTYPSGRSTGTVPVRSSEPNRWGLHHVHGNVWEWVQDCYVDSYKYIPDDGTPAPCDCPNTRVARGGSWGNGPEDLRSAKRLPVSPTLRPKDIGFRVARTLMP